jgi:tRNA (guanosine-2'-O-)-methyltransferase
VEAEEPLEALLARMSARRAERLRAAVAHRMRGIAVVLDGLHDPGNRSAVYRTTEGLGLLEVHVTRIEQARKRHAREVSRGTEKWLRIRSHDSPAATAAWLRQAGYRVFTSRIVGGVPIESIDFSLPVALVFGNEHDGVSDDLHAAADGHFALPMHGLVESFNISVAAGMALAAARVRRERALGARTDLSAVERDALFAAYVRQSARWIRQPKKRRDTLPPE